MDMRFIAYFVFGLMFSSVQLCLSSDMDEVMDSDLSKKIELLEKQLLELKQQHQERVKFQSPEEDVSTISDPPPPVSAKVEKNKKKDKSEVAEKDKKDTADKEPQEAANDSQAQELYTQALILLNQNRPGQAKPILDNLCESYPEYLIQAKYWLGEIERAAGNHTNASIAYGEAYSSYKEMLNNKGSIPDKVRKRAIESLAKLASCLRILNKRRDACVTLEQFNKENSNIPYNVQRFALQVGEQLKCQKKPQL
jgi:TolA-binding protein